MSHVRKYRRAEECCILQRLAINTLAVEYETGEVFTVHQGAARRLTEYPGGRCGRYRFVMIHHEGARRKMPVSRICWMACHGRLVPPGHDIDHINGNPSDNRIDNLRVLDAKINRGAWAYSDTDPEPEV